MKFDRNLFVGALALTVWCSGVPIAFAEEAGVATASTTTPTAPTPASAVGEVRKEGTGETSEDSGGIMGRDGAAAQKDEPVFSSSDEPKSPDDQIDDDRAKADRAYAAENFEQAAQLYKKVLSASNCPIDSAVLQMRLGNCYARQFKYAQAEPLFKKALAKADSDKNTDLQVACWMGLAVCSFHHDNYGEAEKLARRSLQLCPEKGSSEYSHAILNLACGETLYRQLKYAPALEYYKQALNECHNDVRVKMGALSGASACYVKLEQFDQAKATCEQLAAIERKLYGDTSLDYGWTLERLSETYKAVGDPKNQALYEKAVWIFRKSNVDRLMQQYNLNQADDSSINVDERAHRQALRARLVTLVYGTRAREFNNDDAFLADIPLDTSLDRPLSGAIPVDVRKTDAPGYVWLDPAADFKAMVICVHGLGLEHKAFSSFAQRIAPEGFITVAFDVRGFGTYAQAKGKEHLDMNGCIDDLRSVVSLLRRDNPNLPLFLLGESMGGAIALRLAAEAPELIDGLICSVPSGSRYKAKRTAFAVALHYIGNKHKPFNIGEEVVKQATTQQSVRDEWTTDPAARLKLSPSELVQFQRFMDQNPKYAKLIKTTPTVLLQGDDDKLVKKKGTFELFEALPSEDKSMILVGHTEHLIFEAGQFRDGLALGVVGWMQAHMPVCQLPARKAAMQPATSVSTP